MKSNDAAYKVCCAALTKRLLRVAPKLALDGKGYVSKPSENLVEGIRLEDFELDLRLGAGKELESKFLAPYSSSALAVNAFARFKRENGDVPLPTGGNYKVVGFEQKCPHGLKRGTPPHLDVLTDGPLGVVGIESKCLEFLHQHEAKFSSSYDKEILDGRRSSVWFEEMQRLVAMPRRYQWLDAAQLVKHALGLAHTYPGRPTTLLYLFWEPSDSNAYPVFAEHRAEIARFAMSKMSGTPRFASMSYPELWKLWDRFDGPGWLATHVCHLRARYELTL